jgi:2-succinyl-6-hydroxy-2,4-cyclohexadiene-1-carboxylate synthase
VPDAEHCWISETGLAGLRLGSNRDDPPRTLLLHGFAGGAADWSVCWEGRAPALALDLPGHGASADPLGGWDEAIGRLLAALPPSIDRLIGYSLGGRIALGMLRAAPERFRSVTLVSAHPGLSNPAERAVRRASDRCWIELLRRDGVPGFVCRWESLPLFAGQARLPAETLARQRARRLSHRSEGLMASMAVFGLAEMPDTREDLRRFPGTLRWIVGMDDPTFARVARHVMDLRPHTDLHLLEGVGHNVLLEAPQRLADLLG